MIKDIIYKAGVELRKQYNDISISFAKERFDLVSQSDLVIEKLIIDELKEHYPDYTIFSEETGSIEGSSEYRWIIDPIDGTADFIFGVPYFSISLCLEKNGEICEGYVYNPISDELYYSTNKDNIAYLNDNEITTSRITEISDSLIAFGFSANFENITRYHTDWSYIFNNCKKGMPLIAPALTICNMARGRIEGYVDFGSSMEGQAAAGFILKNAGGQLYNYDFSEWSHKEKGVIATNGKIDLKQIPKR